MQRSIGTASHTAKKLMERIQSCIFTLILTGALLVFFEENGSAPSSCFVWTLQLSPWKRKIRLM